MAKKNILKIIVIAAIVLVTAFAVSFIIYWKDSSQHKGPKTVYLEFLGKTQQTRNLEELMDLSIEYGYFESPTQKNQVSSSLKEDLSRLTSSQKSQQFSYLKSFFGEELSVAASAIEAVNGPKATIQFNTARGGVSVVMLKEGLNWKIGQ